MSSLNSFRLAHTLFGIPTYLSENYGRKPYGEILEYWYGMEYISRDPLANKAHEPYKILISCFGGNIPVQAYLYSLEFLADRSVDDILKTVSSVVPFVISNSFSHNVLGQLIRIETR